ncbi:hypothetical protein CpB0292 [Chlamydia pneumoniae TW-183]|uniref:Uncharacterized protein n=1 Tax=Chlamydia pneumoniae TaxID=83558 RepID=A0ABN3YQ23_CHLPN|nr:hypothetical protein CpB0292 [Chlamydia pneumoniae TW-183]
MKSSLRPITYLILAILAIATLMSVLYFCGIISVGTFVLGMLIPLSVCSVLCVAYLFYQQSSIEKTKVFSITSPSVFFSDEDLNLLLGREEDSVSAIDELLKNFPADDFRRPKMLPYSNFLDEQGRPNESREEDSHTSKIL